MHDKETRPKTVSQSHGRLFMCSGHHDVLSVYRSRRNAEDLLTNRARATVAFASALV